MELSYPIIVLSKNDNMVYVYFEEKDFKSTSEDLLKKIDYTALEIIDNLGDNYKIKKVYKVKLLGLWGYNPLLKGRQILIDFEYNSEVQKVSLESFKEEIIKKLEKKKKFWEASYNFKELKHSVYQSSSFSMIAKLLK